MRGGIFRRAWLALAAALAIPTICTNHAVAHDGDHDCKPGPPERSIVVAHDHGQSSDEETPAADEQGLEPIAVVSDRVPELAEPPGLAEPTLAEPLPPKADRVEVTDRLEDANSSLADSGPAEAKVLSFHGITPGISTRIRVLRTWGDPRSEDTTASELKYRFEQLKNVLVHFDGDVVDAIEVELPNLLKAEKLVRSLGLESIRPTIVWGESGQPTALAMPERGVLLLLDEANAPSADEVKTCPVELEGQRIARVILQPIKAELFLQRAENEVDCNLTLVMQDLDRALQLDHDSAKAKWLLSGQLLRCGQAVRAERLAAEAVEAEPKNNAFRLRLSRCLRMLARYDLAAKEAKKVFNSPMASQLERAEALLELGQLASLGSAEVATRVVPLLTNTIEVCDELATSSDPRERIAANILMLEAHLDMALFISKGDFLQKNEAVPQWIERASAISEQMIACDQQHLFTRLQVALTALAAGANLEPPLDPQLWITEAEQTAEELIDSSADSRLREIYRWNLGLAYFQAAQIEHLRERGNSSLELSAKADTQLSELADGRDELPDTSYLMGRLYFQMGAVHAIHNEDHQQACKWYDQAVDHLVDPFPVTTLSGPQQHGDALVSMGVSYWHQKQRPRAIELTQRGADLIKQAVDKGVLDAEALLVPYGNLAAMYEAEGKSNSAAKYTQLAQQLNEIEDTEQR